MDPFPSDQTNRLLHPTPEDVGVQTPRQGLAEDPAAPTETLDLSPHSIDRSESPTTSTGDTGSPRLGTRLKAKASKLATRLHLSGKPKHHEQPAHRVIVEQVHGDQPRTPLQVELPPASVSAPTAPTAEERGLQQEASAGAEATRAAHAAFSDDKDAAVETWIIGPAPQDTSALADRPSIEQVRQASPIEPRVPAGPFAADQEVSVHAPTKPEEYSAETPVLPVGPFGAVQEASVDAAVDVQHAIASSSHTSRASIDRDVESQTLPVEALTPYAVVQGGGAGQASSAAHRLATVANGGGPRKHEEAAAEEQEQYNVEGEDEVQDLLTMPMKPEEASAVEDIESEQAVCTSEFSELYGDQAELQGKVREATKEREASGEEAGDVEESSKDKEVATTEEKQCLPMPELLPCSEEDLLSSGGPLAPGKVEAVRSLYEDVPLSSEEIEEVSQEKEKKQEAGEGEQQQVALEPAESQASTTEEAVRKKRTFKHKLLAPLGQPLGSFNTNLVMPFVEVPDSMQLPSLQEVKRTAFQTATRPFVFFGQWIVNNPATAAALTAMAYAAHLTAPKALDFARRDPRLALLALTATIAAIIVVSLLFSKANPLFQLAVTEQEMQALDNPDAPPSNPRTSASASEGDAPVGPNKSAKDETARDLGEEATEEVMEDIAGVKHEDKPSVLGAIEHAAEKAYEKVFGASGDPGHEMVGDVYQEQESGGEVKVKGEGGDEEKEASAGSGIVEKVLGVPAGPGGAGEVRPTTAEAEGGYDSDSDVPGATIQGVHFHRPQEEL